MANAQHTATYQDREQIAAKHKLVLSKRFVQNQNVQKARYFDADGDGYISIKELELKLIEVDHLAYFYMPKGVMGALLAAIGIGPYSTQKKAYFDDLSFLGRTIRLYMNRFGLETIKIQDLVGLI